MEDRALRHQLAVYKQTVARPRLRPQGHETGGSHPHVGEAAGGDGA